MNLRKLRVFLRIVWLVVLLSPGTAAAENMENDTGVFQTGPRVARRLKNDSSKNSLLVTSSVDYKAERRKTAETAAPQEEVEEVPIEVSSTPADTTAAQRTSRIPIEAIETTSTTFTTATAAASAQEVPWTKPVVQSPKLWPNRTIIYKLNSTGFSGDQLKQLRRALKTLEISTGCIKTRQAGPKDLDFVEILHTNKSKFRCEATWGYQKGRQEFKVHKECFSQGLRWILLELLRLLGFPYEHQRADRDEFVSINFDNIKEGGLEYFEKLHPTHHPHFNLPYNFESFLHYDTFGSGWSKNKSIPVITTLDPRFQERIGRSRDLNSGDIRKIRVVYGCDPPPEGAGGEDSS